MHIVIATPGYPPFIGGGERHTGTLAGHLLERGHALTIFTSTALSEPDYWLGRGSDIEVENPRPGYQIIRVPISPMPGGLRGLLAWRKGMVLISAFPGTRKVLQAMAKRVPGLLKVDEAIRSIDDSVDVVHGFNVSWEHAMLAGWQFAKYHEKPFIASPLAHMGTAPGDRVAKNSTMRHQRYMLSTADMLLTNTAIEAQGLRLSGVTQEAVGVAGPGVNIPEDVAPFPEAGKALKPYVLFIGRSSYDKGVFHAVRAVLRLRERGKRIHLVMIGLETEQFRRFYEELPVADRQVIHHLGFVDESLKHAYLANAEALLLPSSSDSFGIVLLESWLHGRPVIAADAGGIPAVVDDRANGILVPFGDVVALSSAIELLAADQDLNRTLGHNGQLKLNANYTWEIVTDKVLNAYQQVINTNLFKKTPSAN